MTSRKRRSLVRGHKIYVYSSPPPRWKPPIESIPVDYVRGKPEGATKDDCLPDENDEIRHPDEIGDEAAVVAFLGAVFDEVLGNVGEVIGDDNDAGRTITDDSNEEPQP